MNEAVINQKPKRVMKPVLRMAIHCDRYAIYIGKDVIKILGEPDTVCLLIGNDRRSLAVRPCASSEAMSFRVPEKFMTERNCKFAIFSKLFVGRIMEENNLDRDKTYRIEGKYDPEHNVVVFPLGAVAPWRKGAKDNEEDKIMVKT